MLQFIFWPDNRVQFCVSKTHNMSLKLKNKVALITGGSAGIGLATAKLFVEEGAQVVITGRNKDSLDKAADEIGSAVTAIPCDSSSLADLGRLYKTVHEKFGKIDILIVNAAIYVIGPLSDFTEAMFDKQSNVNFKGTFFTVQKSLPYLNDGSSIVLLSSVVAEKGLPNHASYAATKAAIRSMSRSFSAELLGRGIRVNTLSPGPIDTNVLDQVTSTKEEANNFKDGMRAFTPAKRLGRPEEVAAAALYLASADSAFMIGADLLLDGGIRSL
jgi:NAD(P)-dependent dehydrogenase (short-subunit alcohol dehydrogenase family)